MCLSETAVMPRALVRIFCLLSLVIFAAVAAPDHANAQSRELKNTGAIGETIDGYLGIVDAAAAQGLAGKVDAVNAARRNAYQNASADTGRSLSEVQAVAGARLREKAQSGDWVQNAAGEWVQKP
jgi:hypothetical protein